MTVRLSLARRRFLKAMPVGASAFAGPRLAAARNEPPPDQRPVAQVQFEGRVATTYWTWRRLESNELRRSQLAEERGRDLREIMSDTTFFAEWQMVVAHVGLDDGGHAWIALMSTGETTPRTMLTSAAVTAGDTLRQRLPASILELAPTLEKGDYVIASGDLFHDHVDGYLELGRVLGRSAEIRMQYPQFCVRFSALRKVASSTD